MHFPIHVYRPLNSISLGPRLMARPSNKFRFFKMGGDVIKEQNMFQHINLPMQQLRKIFYITTSHNYNCKQQSTFLGLPI